MKKILPLIVLMTGFAHAANDAPTLRGEWANTTLPQSNLVTNPVANLPMPKSTVSQLVRMPTVLIASNKNGPQKLDVTLLDDFINDVSPNARHYPPNFPNRTAEHFTKQNIKYLSSWLEPYANAKNASIEVLLRAAKINAMGRNLDLGSDYGVKASNHIAKVLTLNPNHAEANFLYGMMLSEGGGFKEGKKYLDKAVSLGYTEAEQSLAQADLLNENRSGALARLQKLQSQDLSNPQLAKQIDIINAGGFYIWDIKDNDIHVKPPKP